MPKSRHRRKGKRRPRPQEAAGPVKKPDPSPRWVPVTGLALCLVGVAVIIVNYVPNFLWTTNWGLVAGFGFMAAGFGFLTQWR